MARLSIMALCVALTKQPDPCFTSDKGCLMESKRCYLSMLLRSGQRQASSFFRFLSHLGRTAWAKCWWAMLWLSWGPREQRTKSPSFPTAHSITQACRTMQQRSERVEPCLQDLPLHTVDNCRVVILKAGICFCTSVMCHQMDSKSHWSAILLKFFSVNYVYETSTPFKNPNFFWTPWNDPLPPSRFYC